MFEISTSILNIDKKNIAQIIMNLEKAHTNYYHIDVMDGKFVENDTYIKMLQNCREIKMLSNLPLDVHLMVKDVQNAIDDFLCVEPNIITFHLEVCENDKQIFEYINQIKQNNCRVGIAIKPDTEIEKVYKFLPYIHMCLVMTVNPGKGGQKLMIEMVDKIEKLKTYIDKNNIDIDIEVDGGINLKTCEDVKRAGANILVAGTAILNSNNYKNVIDELKK